MILLRAHDLGWLNDEQDDPNDLCAHGRVGLRSADVDFCKPEDGRWTVSAAGLYLLRTLTDDHSGEDTVARMNVLIPCCGFSVWPTEDRYPVMCCGCDLGIDFEVRHRGTAVHLSRAGVERVVDESEWRDAVLGFVQQVEDLYARSLPKVEETITLEGQGWARFWVEWHARIAHARASTPRT